MPETKRKSRRRTPEGQESYMINLAMEQAEEQLRKHSAPAMIVAHFLKLGTAKALAELEKAKADAKLSNSKADIIDQQKRAEEIADQALQAFKKYAGISEDDEDEDEYYDD